MTDSICDPINKFNGYFSADYIMITSISFEIYLVSLVISFLYVYYVKQMGYSTFTRMYSALIPGLTLVYYINYCFLYLIGPMDFLINK